MFAFITVIYMCVFVCVCLSYLEREGGESICMLYTHTFLHDIIYTVWG